ncbi:MAG: hypothetical protein P8188_00305 [Gemmatimonadota bacterium]
MASHLLGMVAYATLSPVIVGYTLLVLAVFAFGLLGGGLTEDGSLVQNAVLAALAVGDGAWVEWVWRRELSFEENALRLFGGVGLLLWVGDLVLSTVRRGGKETPAPAFLEAFKGLFVRLGLFTLGLCTVLLVSVLVVQAREVGLTMGWGVRAAATAYAMGLAIFLFSIPALVAWFVMDRARGPLARAIVTGSFAPSDSAGGA